jgi:phenylpropionate dioxygenase-like ring-hydroxylating dioxygenase large terminal subunit
VGFGGGGGTPGWHFVARADEVPEGGDYLTVDTVPGLLALLRDAAGGLHAVANTCRHRGARLLDGRGRCRTIVCPYHGWTYGLDGALLGAPGMRDPGPGAGRAGGAHRPAAPVSGRLRQWSSISFEYDSYRAWIWLTYLTGSPQRQ